jgi:small subunit ribosomal protein S1
MSIATATTSPNTESFASLFEESLSRQEMRAGEVITAEVVRIDQNFVVVNAGLKSESFIAIDEFRSDRGEVEVKPGDYVSVAIEMLEDGYGETRLSREKAKRIAAWNDLEKALNEGALVKGVINGKVKGGLTVMTNGIRAFLPGSLVDVRPVKDTTPYENKEFEFKVIKLDRKRNNVVVSRRAVLEASAGEEREQLLANLKEGTVVKGIVKNITDYGAFVDLGGIDGLLHITDLAWRRVRHPSEVLNVGDEVTAKVLKFDQEKNRVSLGLKQLGEDPWVGISRRYPQGTRLFGKVTNLTDYGAFVEVEQGIEGLVHVSEMDWTNKNVHPSKVVQLGDEVEVMILEIDEDRRRISLGMKQCLPNPWDEFSMNHKKGDKVCGQIKSITDFRHLHRPARQHRRPGSPLRPVLVGGRRGSRAQLQEGRRGRGGGAGHRRRARAHLARHQAAGGRPLHQLHRHPRQEQRRQGHGEERRCPWCGGAAVRRGRGLPARLRGRPRARRGPAHAAQGR